jgi:hypothetical protein
MICMVRSSVINMFKICIEIYFFSKNSIYFIFSQRKLKIKANELIHIHYNSKDQDSFMVS